MSATTSIAWTDRSWNPVRGCALVSDGCRNCYAMKQAHRFSGPGKAYAGLTKVGPHGPTWTGAIRTVPEALDEPLRWKAPQRIFVNSMSDLFHADVPETFIRAVFSAMFTCDRHTFQILTKRPHHMREVLNWLGGHFLAAGATWPLPNVWLGVSVENQRCYDARVPLLLSTPAAVRFVSAEPLLGPIDLRLRTDGSLMNEHPQTPPLGLDWIIVGGESGPQARPFDLGWGRSIVVQCHAAGVACFVKQLGARAYGPDVHSAILRDRKGGDIAEFPRDLRLREFPVVRS